MGLRSYTANQQQKAADKFAELGDEHRDKALANLRQRRSWLVFRIAANVAAIAQATDSDLDGRARDLFYVEQAIAALEAAA